MAKRADTTKAADNKPKLDARAQADTARNTGRGGETGIAAEDAAKASSATGSPASAPPASPEANLRGATPSPSSGRAHEAAQEEREPARSGGLHARQTPEGAGRPLDAAPVAPERRSIPRWILILAGAIAVVAIISYFVVGDREQEVTTDTLPQQIGPQGDPQPVTTPTPATPAPSPEPATPAQPPRPVQ